MLYLGKACFTADNRSYAFTRLDGAVQVNDAETGEAVDVYYGHTKPALGIAFSVDGAFFVTGSMDGTIVIRDLRRDTGADEVLNTIHLPSNPVVSISVSPDSTRFASASVGDYHALRMWSLTTGEQLQALEYHAEAVYEARFSPDGLRLASAGWDKRIVLWDLTLQADRGRSLAEGDRVLDGHTGDVISIDFSPDGRLLASGSYDKTIRIWDTRTGQVVRETTAHSDPVTSVRFLKPGILASASFDKTIKFWDTELTLLKTLGPYPHGIHSIAFSHNRKYVVAITRAGPIAGKTPDISS